MRNKFNRILVLTAVFLLVAAVPFIGFTQTTKRYDGVTLRVLTMQHEPIKQSIIKSIPRAKAELGVDIMVDEGEYTTTKQKTVNAALAKTGQYDITTMADQWTGEFQKGKYIVPLDDMLAKDAAFKNAIVQVPLTFTQFNGKQWGIPFAIEMTIRFYRTDILQKEKLEPPTDWDKYWKIVKYFNKNPKYPDFYGGAEMYARDQGYLIGWLNRYWQNYDFKSVKTKNGFWDENYKNCFDKKAFIEAVNNAKELYKYMPEGVQSFSLPEALDFFIKGNAASVLLWAAGMGNASEDPSRSNVVGKVAAVPAPGVPFAASWQLTIASASKNKEAAWAYIRWLTTPANDLGFWVDNGKTPILAATYDKPEAKKLYYIGTLKDTLKISRNCGNIEAMEDFYGGDLFPTAMDGVVGKTTPEVTADKVSKLISELLEKSGHPQK
jgi:multiple sugar transport system substrate-binding protein